MKTCIFLFLFCLLANLSAQNFEKFTDAERLLIQANPTEMMRVYNRVNLTDSVVLKSISKPVDATDKLVQMLAERMLLSVKHEGGVGIAAPQVGINRRLIVVQRFDKPGNPFEAMINPEILWHSELMQKGPEGDLSFDERGFVMRYYTVQVQYQNVNGKTIMEMLEGFTSVIFQHERDHLDGTLLTDRIKEQESLHFEAASDKYNLFFIKN